MRCILIGIYYKLNFEEIEKKGGKVIHIDKNLGNMNDVHKLVCANISKYPNAKWELYPMVINN